MSNGGFRRLPRSFQIPADNKKPIPVVPEMGSGLKSLKL
jgi:hypothetical protein